MTHSRRSVLSALGVALPFGLGAGFKAAAGRAGDAPVLRFRSFEGAVREAFADLSLSPGDDPAGQAFPCRRVEVGHSEQVRAGVQGCHNDRPFAGFPAGHLRLVRTRSEPGPVWRGVRLYVSTVDVAFTGGLSPDALSRPLDFASLPPAPTLA